MKPCAVSPDTGDICWKTAVVIRRYRLHEAAALLSEGRAIKYASLAADLGYSDQAHFVRDFKEIAGVTPAAYAKAAGYS